MSDWGSSRPEDRYRNDPVFKSLVDVLSCMLENNAMRNWTPTELREAVMLAACRYEMTHVRPLFIHGSDYGNYGKEKV